MKKVLLAIFSGLLLLTAATAAEPYSFDLTIPIQIDDFEESTSVLSVSGASSNTNLIPTVSITPSPTNSAWRQIRLLSVPDTSGNAQISINICDNGYWSSRTPLLSITPGLTLSTNVDSTNYSSITLVGSNNAVHLNWVGASNQFGYKINRFTTNNFSVDKQFTLKTVQTTNFVDTNVVNGKLYWYVVTWVPSDAVAETNSKCTNLVFQVKIREPIAVRPNFPNGVSFLTKSNAIYQVFTKTNASQVAWNLWLEINAESNKMIVLSDVGENIIHVREKE